MSVRFSAVSPRLPVRDLGRTLTFYTKTLGFVTELIWPDDVPTFAIVRRGDALVQFWKAADTETIGDALISFDVSDARAMHAVLSDRITVDWGPEVYWYGRLEFAIRDPDGYQLVFSEETGEEVSHGEP